MHLIRQNNDVIYIDELDLVSSTYSNSMELTSVSAVGQKLMFSIQLLFIYLKYYLRLVWLRFKSR